MVIGTTSGRWLVMDAETREMYSQHQDGNEPIQVRDTVNVAVDMADVDVVRQFYMLLGTVFVDVNY